MDVWSKTTLKLLLVPGGLLLLAVVVPLQSRLVSISPAAIDFYYYAVLVAGVLLAWRFHSTRVFFVLLTIFLGHRALEFFSAGRVSSIGPGHIALAALAVLLPFNFVLFSFSRERGWSPSALAPRLTLLFFESVYVAVFCRPGETTGPAFLHPAFLGRHWFHLSVPPFGVLAFILALGTLLGRFFYYRRPVESGLLWSLTAVFISLEERGHTTLSSAYAATAGLVLVSSIVENSYLLAFHDELTTLPARRAFNDALLRLERPYTIATVDIDHFKSFNDTYGHEIGDQVLRMVAAKLGRVSGGGHAFRVGGEEFSILFPGKSLKETVDHLELLRLCVQDSVFRVRTQEVSPPIPDRRRPQHGKRPRPRRPRTLTTEKELSVTVSIGAAEAGPTMGEVSQVLRAADKALYRAKDAGRNQVALATPTRARLAGRTA